MSPPGESSRGSEGQARADRPRPASGLAWTHRRGPWIDIQLARAFEPANAALQRSPALAPTLAEALAGAGFNTYGYDFDWPLPERRFHAALSANSSSAIADFGLALLLPTRDRVDEGLTNMRLTRELDPMSPVFNTLEASFLLDKGHLAEADKRQGRALEIASNPWLTHLALGRPHEARQQPDEALAALRKAVGLGAEISRPQAVLGAHLAVALARRAAPHPRQVACASGTALRAADLAGGTARRAP